MTVPQGGHQIVDGMDVAVELRGAVADAAHDMGVAATEPPIAEVLGLADPGPVVIDEVLGMLMTLALLPLSLTGVIAGFLLFRVLDVVKPFPAGRLEHAPRGWGIMLDDAMAGVYGHLVLRVCIWAWPAWMVA